MFVRRHRLTIEIEQQTLRIQQRCASTTTDPEFSSPEPKNPRSSNPTQSNHTSAHAILPEATTLTPAIGPGEAVDPDNSATHPPIIITVGNSVAGELLTREPLTCEPMVSAEPQTLQPSKTFLEPETASVPDRFRNPKRFRDPDTP
jgi:hypothetical protein